MYFLITWATYGYWLPGDPRGFRTHHCRQEVSPPKRYAENGERSYDPQEYEGLYTRIKKMVPRPVRLGRNHIEVTAEVIADIASGLGVRGVAAVVPYHVHVLANLPESLTTGRFCQRVKRKTSLRLSDYGLKGKVWARRYHAKRIEEEHLKHAYRYVDSHADQGAVVVKF